MKTYTVIWRGDHEFFFFTEVEVEKDKAMTPLNWVQEAARVEYDEWDTEDLLELLKALEKDFELLDVLHGRVESAI